MSVICKVNKRKYSRGWAAHVKACESCAKGDFGTEEDLKKWLEAAPETAPETAPEAAPEAAPAEAEARTNIPLKNGVFL